MIAVVTVGNSGRKRRNNFYFLYTVPQNPILVGKVKKQANKIVRGVSGTAKAA